MNFKPTYETINEFKLIGLKLDGKTTNKDDQSSKDCGELWQKFESDNIFERIPEKLSDETYAVFFIMRKMRQLPFHILLGVKSISKRVYQRNFRN